MKAEEEHESLLALANEWLKKSDDLKALKRSGSGIFDPNVITAEAQIYRECARNLKKLIGEP